jgi:hypothetical protein
MKLAINKEGALVEISQSKDGVRYRRTSSCVQYLFVQSGGDCPPSAEQPVTPVTPRNRSSSTKTLQRLKCLALSRMSTPGHFVTYRLDKLRPHSTSLLLQASSMYPVVLYTLQAAA